MKPNESSRPVFYEVIKRHGHWFALAIIITITAAIRLQLLSVPFERDEGEYAYIGQLIL